MRLSKDRQADEEQFEIVGCGNVNDPSCRHFESRKPHDGFAIDAAGTGKHATSNTPSRGPSTVDAPRATRRIAISSRRSVNTPRIFDDTPGCAGSSSHVKFAGRIKMGSS